jgi:UDP-glucose 4-epimerase
MSKILVTGGAGFIGSHVVDHFIAAGHDVVVVDNLFSGFRENLNPAATFYDMDIRDKELTGVFAEEKPDVVNHLAAQMNVTLSLKDPTFDADSNVVGSVNVLQSCVDHGVKKFIYSSTGGAVYGEPADLPASEECAVEPMSHYGLSKYTAELYCQLFRRIYGLGYTVLRYPNVYGPRQTPHGEAGVCAILSELMLGGKAPTLYGNGEPLRDYVYVGDIARANVLALDKGDGETINLGSGRGTSVLEVYAAIKALTDFSGDPVLAPLRKGEVSRIYTTGDRAAEMLDWKPEVPLEEGLAQVVDFARNALAK